MKKFITTFLVLLSLNLWFSFAYTPTNQDLEILKQLKNTLDQINSGNNLNILSFMTQIKKLQPMVSHEPKISYLLSELNSHLYLQFNTAKIKAKQSSKSDWNNFLSGYNTGIVEINMEDKCFWRYNTLDNISFANNFPTALTIATWYRESHCWYYLPKNWDWPFQIIAKDYGTWEITEETFTQSVQDFIDFSKTKYANYKSKVDINLSYTWADINSIISHWAFYNWWYISGRIVIPNAPRYVYEWYSNYNWWEFATWVVRHWLLPKFIKTLEFELINYY